MTLSDTDRQLLDRCLERAPMAWEDFVDRFIPLVCQVAQHAVFSKGLKLDRNLQDDLVADVFLALIQDDFQVLRRFRRESSLATYLTVVARRVVIRKLSRYLPESRQGEMVDAANAGDLIEDTIDSTDQMEHLLEQLPSTDAQLLRYYHFDGLSYQEIQQRTGIPENSLGPMLHRARLALRKLAEASQTTR